MAERKDRWVCWEISPEPPHERGERKTVHFLTPVESDEAAEFAACEFDAQQMIRERWSQEDVGAFHDGVHYIEVETDAGPRRFKVNCRVERTYTAEALPDG